MGEQVQRPISRPYAADLKWQSALSPSTCPYRNTKEEGKERLQESEEMEVKQAHMCLKRLQRQSWGWHESAPGPLWIYCGCLACFLMGLLTVGVSVSLTILHDFETLFIIFICTVQLYFLFFCNFVVLFLKQCLLYRACTRTYYIKPVWLQTQNNTFASALYTLFLL